MPRHVTDSYIVELPVRAGRREARELSIRLDAARQIQNAVTAECLRRMLAPDRSDAPIQGLAEAVAAPARKKARKEKPKEPESAAAGGPVADAGFPVAAELLEEVAAAEAAGIKAASDEALRRAMEAERMAENEIWRPRDQHAEPSDDKFSLRPKG